MQFWSDKQIIAPKSQRHWSALLKLGVVGLCVFSAGCQVTHPQKQTASWFPWLASKPTSSENVQSSKTVNRYLTENPVQGETENKTNQTAKRNSTPSKKSTRGQEAAPVEKTDSVPKYQNVGATATIRGQSPDQSTNRYAAPAQALPLPPPIPSRTDDEENTGESKREDHILPTPTVPAPSPGETGPYSNYGVDPYTTDPSADPYADGQYNEYQSTIAPGASDLPLNDSSAVAPGVLPYVDPDLGITAPSEMQYQPHERTAPIDVYVQEARTGRIILGGSVNSDLGVAGQLIIDERNFDIRRMPRGWKDFWSGRAFRGAGQNFRAEIMPGSQVERYTVSWTERNLFGYLPYSLSVGGFMYTRQFRDWTEQRLGGRVALGYEVTKDLSVSSEIRMEDVKLFDPRVAGVQELDDALGSNDLYTARVRVARDTRDSPFMATQGSLLEVIFDQVFGEYDYQRGAINYSRYFLIRERPDGSGRHTLASTMRLGFTGGQTPIFENYFAGGYSTLRGFSFRGASPVVGDVQVGGEFMFLGSLEYVFPLTADDMLRGVAFVDYGTVEQDIDINSENFRVAPGLGVRVSVPALGPAPLAFDFAVPVNHADTDDRQVFSFFMGFTR